MNRYIRFNEDNLIISVRWGSEIVDGEIESEHGEIGQRLVDGEFIDVPVEPQTPIETMEEKIARLEQQVMNDNLILMDALAMTYEEVMMMRAEMNGGTT